MEYDGFEKLTTQVFISIMDVHGKERRHTERKAQHT
jgi:hypothetical protein